MRIQFNKKPVLLAAAALALTAALTVGSAMAYFTAHTEAGGEVPLNIGFTETEVDEKVDGGGKHIVIHNIGDYDCFVRVKVFSVIDIGYKPSGKWRDGGGDGYWYFDSVLPAGGSTEELLVTFEYPANTEEDKTEEFNIIVVQECTPVVYDEEGNAAADWGRVITSDGTE